MGDIVQNKWNNNLYQIIKDNGSTIIIKRCNDNSELEIAKSEFYFSYRKIK